MTINLRPVTDADFATYLEHAIEAYADDNVRAGTMLPGEAYEQAKRQFGELLPDGPATLGHHLFVAENDGERAGILWLQIRAGADTTQAFVYDIEVDEAFRGRGLGRTIMLAGQAYAHEHGAESIGLHVFTNNAAATRLYDALGYEAVSQNMTKSLP